MYLDDVYGVGVVEKILKKWKDKESEISSISEQLQKDLFAETIKEVTSKDVFVNFKSWYQSR